VPAIAVKPDRAPPRLLFLGDYRHHPNPEAVRHLASSVLPEVRRTLPAAELLVAGPNQDRLADLAAVPGVRLVGFARDLPELLGSVRCLLAPVYSGGGLRTKVLTALAHGLPVVTNALGARGPQVPAPARIVVEDDAGLAAAALRFLREPDLARQAGELAHDWARDRLGPDAVAREQLEAINRLLPARQAERAPPLGEPAAQPGP
jgi:glycosyltransferase involved in cell wall biosynthesis